MTPECPSCHRIDAVAKVTAIVAGGSWRHTEYSIGPSFSSADGGLNLGASLRRTGSRGQNELSRLLSHRERDEGVGCGVLLLLAALGFAFVFAYVMVHITGEWEQAKFPGADALFVITLIATVAVWGYGFYLVTNLDRMAKRREVWKSLYYCYRDDIVYVPGALDRFAPATEMRRLLEP